MSGDIIDGWNILRGYKGKWERRHTNFIKTILNLSHSAKIHMLWNKKDAADAIGAGASIASDRFDISALEDFIAKISRAMISRIGIARLKRSSCAI